MTRCISRLLFVDSTYLPIGYPPTESTPNTLHVHFAKQVLRLSAASDCNMVYLFRRKPNVFRPELDLELYTDSYVSHTTEAGCLDMLQRRRKKK